MTTTIRITVKNVERRFQESLKVRTLRKIPELGLICAGKHWKLRQRNLSCPGPTSFVRFSRRLCSRVKKSAHRVKGRKPSYRYHEEVTFQILSHHDRHDHVTLRHV